MRHNRIQRLLRAYMEDHAMTPASLARELGVSRQRLDSWLNRPRQPAADLLLGLIEARPMGNTTRRLAVALLGLRYPNVAKLLEHTETSHNDNDILM